MPPQASQGGTRVSRCAGVQARVQAQVHPSSFKHSRPCHTVKRRFAGGRRHLARWILPRRGCQCQSLVRKLASGVCLTDNLETSSPRTSNPDWNVAVVSASPCKPKNPKERRQAWETSFPAGPAAQSIVQIWIGYPELILLGCGRACCCELPYCLMLVCSSLSLFFPVQFPTHPDTVP